MLGLNLDQDINYSEIARVCEYPHSLQANASIVLRLGHGHFLQNPSEIYHSCIIYHVTLYSVATDGVVKYTNEVYRSGGTAPCIPNLASHSGQLSSRLGPFTSGETPWYPVYMSLEQPWS
jgi:hypothetical protein